MSSRIIINILKEVREGILHPWNKIRMLFKKLQRNIQTRKEELLEIKTMIINIKNKERGHFSENRAKRKRSGM